MRPETRAIVLFLLFVAPLVCVGAAAEPGGVSASSVQGAEEDVWAPLQPVTREDPTSVYDPVRNRMLVIGGRPDVGLNRDGVWALSLSGPAVWRMLPKSGVPPTDRRGQVAIYDPVRDRVVVYSGLDVWTLSLSDTTSTWKELRILGAGPSRRDNFSAIYDPVRDRIIVFAGLNDYTFYNDVWALPLSGAPVWALLTPTGAAPSIRFGHSAIYDPVRDRMIVFGGIPKLTPRARAPMPYPCRTLLRGACSRRSVNRHWSEGITPPSTIRYAIG